MNDYNCPIPIPFEEGDANECMELIRVWATGNNTIACSARLELPGLWKDDVALLGMALADLAHQFASHAAQTHNLDFEVVYTETAQKLRELFPCLK